MSDVPPTGPNTGETPNPQQSNYPQQPQQPQFSPPAQPAFPPTMPPPSGYPPAYPPSGQYPQPNPSAPYPPPYAGATGPYPPGAPFNPAGYPPQMPPPTGPGYPPQFAPIPPPKKGLKGWQWVIIGASSILLACCMISIIAAAFSGNQPNGSSSQNGNSVAHISPTKTPRTIATQLPFITQIPTPTPVATTTPISTASPKPTATVRPKPTATPIPSGQGDHMQLGINYQNVNGIFSIVTPTGSFKASDPLAYVITLDHGIGTTQAQLILVRLYSGGVESTVFSQIEAISNPNFAEFANQIPRIGDIMSAYGQVAGQYRLEMSDGYNVVAKADFTYTG